jgi:ketosteroid isomerase-like protein
MKLLILFTAISISLFSCTSSNDKKENENLAIVRNYMEAVEANNIAKMDSLLASNYKGYGPSVNDSANKEEALSNWKYNAANLYESLKFTRLQNLAKTVKESEEAEAGDWVSSWAYLTIKYKDGRGPVNIWVNAEYKIENGKIVHSRTFYDEADVLRQLNYTIEPPEDNK